MTMSSIRLQFVLVTVSWLAIGCTGLRSNFVQTDLGFHLKAPTQPPVILYETKEVRESPVYQTVGVVEVTGPEAETLNHFAAMATRKGFEHGCDVLVQRDLFETRTALPGRWGVKKRKNAFATWQFLCGVSGGEANQAQVSANVAVAVALRLRSDETAGYECSSAAPTGSHIVRTRCR